MTKTSWRRKIQVVRSYGENADILSHINTLYKKTEDLVQLLAFFSNTEQNFFRESLSFLHGAKSNLTRKLPEPCTMVLFIRNYDFVGRESTLDSISSKFHTSRGPIILIGPEGIG